jgi:hypothetical protein
MAISIGVSHSPNRLWAYHQLSIASERLLVSAPDGAPQICPGIQITFPIA